MRITLLFFAAVLISTTIASALPTSDGRIIRGKYSANGKVSAAGVRVQYYPSIVHVTSHGKVKGCVTKVVSSNGTVLQIKSARVRGTVQPVKVRSRKGNFSASAVIRVDGAAFRGSFNGLTNQRLSRYFRGKVNGQKHSNFVMRSK
jgi:hypothetical protein